MLFITHDLSVLVEVSDRLAIMYAGKIVEEGTANEVFHDPKHPYTEALAAAFPEIGDTRFRRNPRGPRRRPARPAADPVRVPVPPAMRARRSTNARRVVPELWDAGAGPASRVRARGRRPEPGIGEPVTDTEAARSEPLQLGEPVIEVPTST